MTSVERALTELTRIFREERDKRRAHARSRALLEQLSGEKAFLTEALERHLRRPDSLNMSNYPVVALEIATTPDFVLVAHCWIPLPDARTDLSTKAIHHHGSMLLSTANIFGPGYEHWLFTFPQQIGAELYEMKVVEVAPHKLHQVAFVDTWTPHLPVYPSSLTVTLALWSSENPTTWKDQTQAHPHPQAQRTVTPANRCARRVIADARAQDCGELRLLSGRGRIPQYSRSTGVRARTE